MKEEIEKIVGNYVLDRSNDVVSQLHKAFIQAQIDSLKEIKSKGSIYRPHYVLLEDRIQSLTKILEDE